jgi:TorA maturation chaperone TorD
MRNMQALDEVDLARAAEYSLLSALLLRSPDAQTLARLANLRGDDTELGRAHTALGEAASRADTESVSREFFELFIGLGRGELLPYASFYLTGFVQAAPLAQLRQDLRELGIERAEGLTEPEDHAAVLLDIMGSLASGSLAVSAEAERELFQDYLAPWIARFFRDLERGKAANFYGRLGTVGRVFMQIEQAGFDLLEPNT